MNKFLTESISPETLAAKFAAAKNLTNLDFAEALQDNPQLGELLWFLQWISSQPGGLDRFVAATVVDFATSFGPAWIHNHDSKPSLEKLLEAWELLPEKNQEKLIPLALWTGRKDVEPIGFCWCYLSPINDTERKKFHAALSRLPVNVMAETFTSAAKNEIPGILRTICNETLLWKSPRRWFCEDIIGVLIESMDLQAARALQTLARTELVDIVFDHLDYAWSERRVVKIDGQSRTGKTEAVRAWASAYPGRCRLVTTPCGISTRDLFSAFAESLCVAFGPETSIQKLKDRLQFVIRHCGLMFIVDEAHYVLPSPSSQAAVPARLDWLRSNVIDRRLPCALVCTPQNWKLAQARLEKCGYNFDQVLGRIDFSVTLPEEPRPADLDAVVELHGLGIPQELHQFIVLKVTSKEAYLKSIEAICCRARYLAKKARRPVCQADVEKAVVEVIPLTGAKQKPAQLQQENGTKIPIPSRLRKQAPALESAPRQSITELQPST